MNKSPYKGMCGIEYSINPELPENLLNSLHNYLADHPTEILSLNETWLQPTDSDNFVSSLAPVRRGECKIE